MITLTTDFGDSHYTGALRGAILSVHPGARLVDLTHGVPRHNVRAGAFALAAAVPYFPRGTVHVAVVDPGVGTPRRPLLVECERGLLVGPDNGLLLPAARRLGFKQARELTNRALWRGEVSSTFHGRDIFGPVAAHLDQGLEPAKAGEEIADPHDLDFGQGRLEDATLVGEVILVDGFGNCVTNIAAELARKALREGADARVGWAGGEIEAPLRRAYAEAPPGEPLLVVGSAGYLEVAMAEGSFAERSGLEVGMQVRIRPA
ncbi:MAG TPA: SAM-dependent chlorinase/fluorinase [Candidatus Thermoplasmatota archaeon]|nr:SAM-dependent chlorinase/fluorinase [Candidatus Thermoplasmatota archaeon]